MKHQDESQNIILSWRNQHKKLQTVRLYDIERVKL